MSKTMISAFGNTREVRAKLEVVGKAILHIPLSHLTYTTRHIAAQIPRFLYGRKMKYGKKGTKTGKDRKKVGKEGRKREIKKERDEQNLNESRKEGNKR